MGDVKFSQFNAGGQLQNGDTLVGLRAGANAKFSSPIPLAPIIGGTGVVSPAAHGIMISEGASAVNPIVLTTGQMLVGVTGADPSPELVVGNPINVSYLSTTVKTRAYHYSETQSFSASPITAFQTFRTITPSTITSLYQCGIVEVRMMGYTATNGPGSIVAIWQFSYDNAVPTVVLIDAKQSVANAPQVQLLPSTNDVLVQLASSDATNNFQGQVWVDVYLGDDIADGVATWTIT
jgi:hypothetical protein